MIEVSKLLEILSQDEDLAIAWDMWLDIEERVPPNPFITDVLNRFRYHGKLSPKQRTSVIRAIFREHRVVNGMPRYNIPPMEYLGEDMSFKALIINARERNNLTDLLLLEERDWKIYGTVVKDNDNPLQSKEIITFNAMLVRIKSTPPYSYVGNIRS